VSTRAFIAVLGVLGVVALLGFGLLSKGEAAIAVGDPAPDGELEELVGADGADRIADYRGGWLLINFWASWCDPCRDESPLLDRWHRRIEPRGGTVLGIDILDVADDARDFVEEYGLDYPQLRDGEGKTLSEYGIVAYPETFVIDKRGRIAASRRGPVDDEFLRRSVLPLLREPA
jgi:cytochrome c biogenesis protein CcmG, thiol:disulfide interchange protein DsbE